MVSHLSEAAEAGLPLDIRRTGLTEATQKLITEAIRAPPINSGMQNCLCECYCIVHRYQVSSRTLQDEIVIGTQLISLRFRSWKFVKF